MSISLLLLLLLLLCSVQASHFFGTMMTYYPKGTNAAGSTKVVLHYKLNFHSCVTSNPWTCSSGDCGTQISVNTDEVDSESDGEWCQTEGIMTRQLPSTAPFELQFIGNSWVNNVNGIMFWKAVTRVELRTRSDTSRANSSPQTTVLPLLRVPSNCPSDVNLLAFDPDGDEVRCRYGNTALSECNPCTPPSVLSLSSACSLSFSSTSSSVEGLYAVQLVMEDFPRQTITLRQTDGSLAVKTTNNAISKLPVQFVFRVDPAVPSCTEGLYLPRFLPPTPAHRAQLYTPAGQSLEINVNAEASVSTISELLFSGPHDAIQTGSAAGPYVVTWTPSLDEDGESHAFCFVVQALHNSVKYHSELRCIVVTVGDATTTTAAPTTTTTTPTTTPSTTTTTTPTTTTTSTPTTTPSTTTTTPSTTTPTTTTTSTPTTTPSTTTTTPSTTTPSTTTTSTPTTTPSTTTTSTPTTTPSTTTTTTPTTTPSTMTTSTPTTTPSTTTTTTPSTTTTSTPTTTPSTTTTTTPSTTTTTTPTTTPSTTTTTTPTTTLPTTTTTTTTPPARTTTAVPSTPTAPTTMPGDTTPSPSPPTEVQSSIIGLRMRISSLSPISEDDIRTTVIQQLRAVLVSRGLPSDITVSLVHCVQLESWTTATPAGSTPTP